MSKHKPPKKKVVVTTQKKETTPKSTAEIRRKAAVPRKKTSDSKRPVLDGEMIFSRQNYLLILAGLGLVVLGLLLMSGGKLAPDEWDPNVIYSFRRTVLAPIVILGGLGLEIYAIFK